MSMRLVGYSQHKVVKEDHFTCAKGQLKRTVRDPQHDCTELQEDLEQVYKWAREVNMTFNSDKFEAVRFWPKDNSPDFKYLAPDLTPTEEKSDLRDLGVQLSSDLSFSIHIDNITCGVNRLISMAMRTFKNRSHYLMLSLWKTILQPKLDYCSQLWSPSDQTNITKLENPLKNFTATIAGLEGLDYWDRLKLLRIYSQERRRKRYAILLIWKISQGLVDEYGINFTHSPRRDCIAQVKDVFNSVSSTV